MPSLKSPENILWMLAMAVLLLGVRWLIMGRSGGIYFPGAEWLRRFSGPGRVIPRVVQGLLWLALACLAFGLTGPYREKYREEVSAKGVDIVLVLDISTSMSARDFAPASRLEAARAVLRDFIRRRPHDRIALVTFAADAYVQCPLTSDHYSLESLLDNVDLIPFEQDGTSIGMALACALNRLRSSPARSKVIVLLTDGVNNRGEISPLQAADYCRQFNVKAYTIGIGTAGEAEMMARGPDGNPVWVRSRVEYDAETLAAIARTTGGRAFTATDSHALQGIYTEVDSLEKTVLEKKRVAYREEWLPWCLGVAGVMVIAAMLIALRHPLAI